MDGLSDPPLLNVGDRQGPPTVEYPAVGPRPAFKLDLCHDGETKTGNGQGLGAPGLLDRRE